MIWVLLALPVLLLGLGAAAATIHGTRCDRLQTEARVPEREPRAVSLDNAAPVFRVY